MSETFYNLTIARNIQLSRNEKEKSPQNPSKSPFNNKPWMKYNYRREKVKMIGRLPSAWIGEEEISEISIPCTCSLLPLTRDAGWGGSRWGGVSYRVNRSALWRWHRGTRKGMKRWLGVQLGPDPGNRARFAFQTPIPPRAPLLCKYTRATHKHTFVGSFVASHGRVQRPRGRPREGRVVVWGPMVAT